jgi:Zn finger protein HypA/HybF involved in hydrogenase expression
VIDGGIMMRPIYEKPGEKIAKQVEDKVKSEVEGKIKVEVDRRVIEILREREERDKVDKAARLAAAVDKAKSIKGESEKDKDKDDNSDKENKGDKENKEKGHVHDLLCPTCKRGHVHKMESDGLSVKCIGPECGKEYVLIDKKSDYQCATCGVPIKKPEDPDVAKNMAGCPFCGGKKSVRHDWSKTWEVLKK